MKYLGTKPSGKDKEIPVYLFAVGKEEMNLLKGIIIDTHARLPKITELQIVRARLRNMRLVLEKLKLF